jgi:hypothetical protein
MLVGVPRSFLGRGSGRRNAAHTRDPEPYEPVDAGGAGPRNGKDHDRGNCSEENKLVCRHLILSETALIAAEHSKHYSGKTVRMLLSQGVLRAGPINHRRPHRGRSMIGGAAVPKIIAGTHVFWPKRSSSHALIWINIEMTASPILTKGNGADVFLT